jgi:hypothetical protein
MHVAIRYKSRAYFPPLQLCYNTAPTMYIKGTHSHAFHYLHGNDAKAHIFLSYIRVVGITVLQYSCREPDTRASTIPVTVKVLQAQSVKGSGVKIIPHLFVFVQWVDVTAWRRLLIISFGPGARSRIFCALAKCLKHDSDAPFLAIRWCDWNSPRG